MTLKDQKWVNIEDDQGWHIVIPDCDTKPHGFVGKNKRKAEVAGIDCPCKPQINWQDKTIIHNSFLHEDLIEKSLAKHFL